MPIRQPGHVDLVPLDYFTGMRSSGSRRELLSNAGCWESMTVLCAQQQHQQHQHQPRQRLSDFDLQQHGPLSRFPVRPFKQAACGVAIPVTDPLSIYCQTMAWVD